jgi:hypothetical protein
MHTEKLKFLLLGAVLFASSAVLAQQATPAAADSHTGLEVMPASSNEGLTQIELRGAP